MSNSSLVSYTKKSPNCYKPRNHEIDTVTIHMTEGQVSVETLGDIFSKRSRNASSNYGIGPDGRIALYVDECNGSWCSFSKSNDMRAICIEVASDKTAPYKVNAKAYAALINLLVDIVQRNPGFKGSLRWIDDKKYVGKIDKQNMTLHKWFQDTPCPGDYLHSKMGQIAEEVNRKLSNPTPTKDFDVDEIVFFAGSKEYSSASSSVVIPTTPCIAKITKIAVTKEHPYHCRHCDAQGNFRDGGVYGWVDAADVYKFSDYKAAIEVIQGKYGNGAARKTALTNAGYNYKIVQGIVNFLMKS